LRVAGVIPHIIYIQQKNRVVVTARVGEIWAESSAQFGKSRNIGKRYEDARQTTSRKKLSWLVGSTHLKNIN